jgi:phage shock protein A
MAEEMEWLRNYMQSYMADCAPREASEKVVRLRIVRSSASEHTQRALSLISDAAQVISDMEEGALAVQARNEALLAEAIEKLNAAEERINFLESERKAAKTHIRETELKVEDLQSAVDEADSRMKAAGQRLWQAERYARTSAARAEEAEKALVQIEEAIRSQLIGKRFAPRKPVAAA